MLAKKGQVEDYTQGRSYRRELKYLYDRRTALDALIESLRQYDRFRARTSVTESRRKSA